jgi:transcriptional regulator with XRE-family HTH domain
MKKKPSEEIDQESRLLYVLLRHAMDMDRAEFGAATRTAVSQVSLYERGERTLPQDVLERAADECGFPRALLDPAKRAIRSFRVAAKGWSRAERVLAERFFADLLELGASAIEIVLTPEPEPAMAKPEDPETLADLLRRLERRSPRLRLVMVEEIEEFQSPALCELVKAKSRELELENPAEASEWAELARRMAELSGESRGAAPGIQGPERGREDASGIKSF